MTLGSKATLVMTGGVCHIVSLDMGSKAKLLFRGPSDLVIQGRMRTGSESVLGVLGPARASVEPADIRIYVSGTNHPDPGKPSGGHPAAEAGSDSSIRANIYAPNGTIRIKYRGTAEGALIAKDVLLESRASVTLDRGFDLFRPPVITVPQTSHTVAENQALRSWEKYPTDQDSRFPGKPEALISAMISGLLPILPAGRFSRLKFRIM